MKIYIIPITKWGKWSARFLGGFFLFLLLTNLLVALGQEGGETFLDNLPISLSATLGAICGLGAFGSGLFSIFKHQERSLMVFFASFIGLALLFFLIGEFTVPH